MDKIDKSMMIRILHVGMLLNIKLPEYLVIKPSNLTKAAAAAVGGPKGLSVIYNKRIEQVEIFTKIKLTPEGILILNAKGINNHLLINYNHIKSAKLKKHSIKLTLVNNLEFKFKAGLLVRLGMRRAGYRSKFAFRTLYEFILNDYKYTYPQNSK